MASLNDPGFWSRFWSSLTGRSRLAPGERAYPFGQHSTPGGSVVTPENALKLSAVWACVRLRSDTIASLPLNLLDSQMAVAASHPLQRIINGIPNADMTAVEFWQSQVASLDLWGNAYSSIVKSDRRVIALDPLSPNFMSIARAKNGSIAYEYKANDGKEVEYQENEILHIKGFTLDGLVGLSPIQYAADTMGALKDANTAASREFANGLKVGGFLKTQQKLDKDQRDRIRDHLQVFGRAENAGKWMVLEAGMEPASSQGIRMNPIDAQLLESRYFGIEEICRAFGVPPQLIGHTDKASSWASSLENTNLGFLTYALTPVLRRIEQAIEKKLLLPEERARYQPMFNTNSLMRPDAAGRAAYYSTMGNAGFITRNEGRRNEGMPPLAGGDSLTVQSAMVPIEDIGVQENASQNP